MTQKMAGRATNCIMFDFFELPPDRQAEVILVIAVTAIYYAVMFAGSIGG